MGKSRLFAEKSSVLKPIERLRLFIRVRKQGSYIASVPVKQLTKMFKDSYRNWRIEQAENGVWLVLEAS